ncbi:MAG: ATP-binding protein, partial [Planctomycetia bacterium]|nr:ATP-binding protein [Planctomycetia bacterium]
IQAPSGTNAFVTITVDDNGPGIPQEIAENLFDPFVTCNKSGGTGLGLAVTNKIIQEHRGRLKVERSVLGGARFVVELPCVIDEPVEADVHSPFDADSLVTKYNAVEAGSSVIQKSPQQSDSKNT